MTNTLKYLIPFLFLSLISSLGKAQLQTGEYPPSFYQKSLQTLFAESSVLEQIQKPDLSLEKQEDKIEDKIKDIPWRFGKEIDVDFNLNRSGQWAQSNNQSIWRLEIKVPGALSINLNFDQFKLSENARLFIYNQDYSDVLGALTYKNNKVDSLFAIRPIKGDQISLELHIPTNEKSENLISINQLVYGYRDIFSKAAKSFGGSNNCNQNVRCTNGDRWQDVKRSVVMILRSNNTRLCSGALINNLAQDSTPYVLTASHCGIQTNAVFVFNYESPNCQPNANGVLSNSISNAFLKSANSASDFTLFELSATPPLSYNVFYAGFSAENKASQRSTTIHHPSGDVKKFSWDQDSTTESGYYQNGNTHWQVSNWELGTTEGGSSGSPLFDQNQRIVGQLHGGDAACGNALQDYFGKLSYSWASNSANNRQLKAWLDPNNTGQLILDGFDPNPANHSSDLELIHLYGISKYTCDTSVGPRFVVKNRGSQQINFIRIKVLVNNTFSNSIVWNGNLSRNQPVSFDVQNIAYQQGQNEIKIILDSIGPNPDLNPLNDTLSSQVFINKINSTVNLRLKTDDYGSETSWEIKPVNNSSSFSIKSNPYPDVNGGRVYNHPICLFDSCFTLILKDNYSDGFNGAFGNGFLLLTNANGDTLVFENNFTGAQKTYTFCLGLASNLKENYANPSIKVYPNPISRGESIKIDLNKTQLSKLESISILDLQGRIVSTYNTNNNLELPTNIEPGVYLLKLDFYNSSSKLSKLVIQ